MFDERQFPFCSALSATASTRSPILSPVDLVVLLQPQPLVMPACTLPPRTPSASTPSAGTPPSAAHSTPSPHPSAASPSAMTTSDSVAPSRSPPPPHPAPTHHMQTRSCAGIFKPNPRYTLATASALSSSPDTTLSPLPSSARTALWDPNWHAAMEQEFRTLQANRTWRLVDRPPGAHIISDKWVFKHKFNPDGSLEGYKAWWLVRGFTQRAGVDFGETFTLVVKPATIRTVLTIAALRQWPTRQLDVSNAFLHGNLKEHVLCQQPIRFVDADCPNVVCLLDRSLYGLKQAPRAWFTCFATFVIKLGFTSTRSDSSLFVLRRC